MLQDMHAGAFSLKMLRVFENRNSMVRNHAMLRIHFPDTVLFYRFFLHAQSYDHAGLPCLHFPQH